MRSQEVPKIMTPRVFEELHKMPNITTWMTLTGAISNSLDIKDPWNIEKMEGHKGRHTNAYHDLTEYALTEIDRRAKGDTGQFLYVKSFIRNGNSSILLEW